MILYLDCSGRDWAVFGLRSAKGSVVYERVALPAGARERILPLLERFLHYHRVSPRELRRIVVFAGPGQFSGLRIAAVIANTFAVVYDTQLAVLTGTPPDSAHTLRHAFARARSVGLAQPRYGALPSITKPAKKRRR